MAFDPLILTTSLAVAGVVAAIFLVLSVQKYPKGNEKMIGIWTAIREGSNAYLKRQFRTIAIIAIIILAICSIRSPLLCHERERQVHCCRGKVDL